ncbi:MAG: hypothetical protein LBI66_07230 [Burkholderiaceae bacterium]|jgi:hypothetical protein|nr:hypothetical protein [Burkholderiaceae bacterium]
MPNRHAPPAVRHPLSRPAWLAVLLWALWLLAAAGLGAWAAPPHAGPWRLGAALLACLVAGAGLMRGWHALGAGHVDWDGAQWWPPADGRMAVDQPVSLQVWADGGCWLWVQARTQAAGRRHGWWLMLQRQSPETWGELRRAVYSRPRTQDQRP